MREEGFKIRAGRSLAVVAQGDHCFASCVNGVILKCNIPPQLCSMSSKPTRPDSLSRFGTIGVLLL